MSLPSGALEADLFVGGRGPVGKASSRIMYGSIVVHGDLKTQPDAGW